MISPPASDGLGQLIRVGLHDRMPQARNTQTLYFNALQSSAELTQHRIRPRIDTLRDLLARALQSTAAQDRASREPNR